MKKYIRIMLGKGSIHAAECFRDGFVGVDYGFDLDFSGHLPDNWRDFNKEFIPVFLTNHPDKSRIAAGLACGMTWTVTRGLQEGDMVISPNGENRYRVGEVTGPYLFKPGGILPHRRPVRWLEAVIDRKDMGDPLKFAAGAIGVVSDLSKHVAEIEKLMAGKITTETLVDGEIVEDPADFEMEKHLEDFLVNNWAKTSFGEDYEVFQDDGKIVGRQYMTDTGPIDILAISKDKKKLLVIELKRGRTSDVVVGQILRYMGFVQDQLADAGQEVKGVIIALKDDPKLRRALVMVPIIEFYRYQISFKLIKGWI